MGASHLGFIRTPNARSADVTFRPPSLNVYPAPSPCSRRTCRALRHDRHRRGQAGLAAGYFLAIRNADFLIIDSSTRIGDSWRHRWDSLRLFTPAAYSGLPGMPFPAEPMHLPDKDEWPITSGGTPNVSNCPVRLGRAVESLSWNGERYVIDAGVVTYEADHVVVATGPFQTPRIPSIAAELSPAIQQIHSSQYRNPFELAAWPRARRRSGQLRRADRVGARSVSKVTLAGRSTGHLPRRILGRDVYRWFGRFSRGSPANTSTGRMLRKRTHRGDPLIGFGPSQIADAGVTRVGRLDELGDGVPTCDGKAIDASVIVWATGFSPDFSWIRVPMPRERGAPVNVRGVVAVSPGLYFVGLRFQHRLTSALLGGVGADADYVVDHLLAHESAAAADYEIPPAFSSTSARHTFGPNGT
jgi:putative flavoprotein involved in K+ transport